MDEIEYHVTNANVETCWLQILLCKLTIRLWKSLSSVVKTFVRSNLLPIHLNIKRLNTTNFKLFCWEQSGIWWCLFSCFMFCSCFSISIFSSNVSYLGYSLIFSLVWTFDLRPTIKLWRNIECILLLYLFYNCIGRRHNCIVAQPWLTSSYSPCVNPKFVWKLSKSHSPIVNSCFRHRSIS